MKKKIKLIESDHLSAYEKMRLFDRGERRENIKACSDAKAISYYVVCLNNGFRNAELAFEEELINRKLGAWVVPKAKNITPTQFTPYEAQYALKHKDEPAVVIDAALSHPFPGLTESETLLIFLIWGIALELSDLASRIKTYMAGYSSYYLSIPEIITRVSSNPDVSRIIADIVNGLPKELR